MRTHIGLLGMLLALALARPASAQQVISNRSNSFGSSIPSFFAQAMGKPDFSAMSRKPTMPAPLNLGAMMPTIPNLQNTMLLRNIFAGSQMSMPPPIPKKQVPPPPKKKK